LEKACELLPDEDLEGDTDAAMGEEANSLVDAQDRPQQQQQQQQPKKDQQQPQQQQQQPQTQQPPSSPEEKKETAKDGI